MIELGELEGHHDDFARRNTQVVVASLEGVEDARLTQKDFPHLVVLADEKAGLVNAVQVLNPGGGHVGEDVPAPTTFFIDKHGTVRAFRRAGRVMARLSPDEVLEALDAEIK
jgi:peroxiredoxin